MALCFQYSTEKFTLRRSCQCDVHSVTLEAEMTPDQTPCVGEEVQAVMLIPFFIFLMKPPSCHFRGEEGLTSCADESLLLTGQQARIESAVWSSCSVNHSQKAQRRLKGKACE